MALHLIYRLRMTCLWLCRCHLSRGFGIQSPSVYWFVRYVVSVHNPYYAYKKLKEVYPTLHPRERKVYSFLFRLANYLQPLSIVIGREDCEAMRSYLQEGCQRSIIQPSLSLTDVVDFDIFKLERILYIYSIDELPERLWNNVITFMSPDSVMVVTRIHRSKQSLSRWSDVCSHPSVSISLDLYHCGILFFDTARSKQHFVVNF